jgi:hypothetical protein
MWISPRCSRPTSCSCLHIILAGPAGYGGRRIVQLFIPFWNCVVLARILWRWTDIRHWEETAARDLSSKGAPAFVTPGGGPVDVTPIEVTAVDITPGGLG